MNRNALFGIGLVLGGILLLLAVLSFVAAVQWSGADREGAVIGWSVVGFFLTVAGIGAIAGTANHVFRVLAGKGPRSGH